MKNLSQQKIGLGLATVGAGALAAYILAIRPWHLRWGATSEETGASLAGDNVLPDAKINVTHAITINAPAEIVWKFLTQIGQGRGGFFSYDWLENLFGLNIHTAQEIIPELQKLKVGDFIRGAPDQWLGGKFKNKAGWSVVEIIPNSVLILRDEIERGSWAFVLKPIGEKQTRLLIRARGKERKTLFDRIFHYGFMEPAHFVMERKMLLTLKERAETIAPRSM